MSILKTKYSHPVIKSVGVLIFILIGIVIGSSRGYSWSSGSTGMCSDNEGNNFPCSDGGGGGYSGSGGGDDSSTWDYIMPAVPAPAPALSPAQQADEMNNKCVTYHNNGDLERAAACYQAAHNLDPSNTVIMTNFKNAKAALNNKLGAQAFNRKEWYLATIYYEEALSYYGKDAVIEANLRQAREMDRKADEDLDNSVIEFEKERVEWEKAEREKASKSTAVKQNPEPAKDDNALVPKEFKVEKERLEKEYQDLENAISNEKNPLKRVELINKQSYIKSQLGVLQIKILDQFKEKESTKNKEKETKLKALLAVSSLSAYAGNFDSARSNLNEALKEDPDNKGIQKAINYVNYLDDISGEKVVYNPKWIVMVDALSYGEGDWNKTIAYLQNAANADPQDVYLHRALSVIEGMHDEEKHDMTPGRKKDFDEGMKLFNKAQEALSKNDSEKASRLLKQAQEKNPYDPGFRAVRNFVEGINVERNKMRDPETYNARQELKGNFKDAPVYQSPKTLDQFTTNTLTFFMKADYQEAFNTLKEANKLYPGNAYVEDTMNYIEGVLFERNAKKGNNK